MSVRSGWRTVRITAMREDDRRSAVISEEDSAADRGVDSEDNRKYDNEEDSEEKNVEFTE